MLSSVGAILALVVVGFPLLMYLMQDRLLFFPQPLGTLTRGVFVSAGAGVDFETLL